MQISRRQFVVLTSALACGCQAGGGGGAGDSDSPRPLTARDVDAGPVAAFAADGVYDALAREGFFVIRRGEALVALSSVCTHRDCKVRPAPDRSFVCKCHGSRFDPSGHVTKGPAERDLPAFATSVDARGHLIVHVGRSRGA